MQENIFRMSLLSESSEERLEGAGKDGPHDIDIGGAL